MLTRIYDIAYARSGDKGDKVNIGVVARDPRFYPILLDQVTTERVKHHFRDVCFGDVKRYELPNFHALNFVLDAALDGGGASSLRLDPQGKTMCDALLLMPIDVPDELTEESRAG